MKKIISYVLILIMISMISAVNTAYSAESETMCSIGFSPDKISQGEGTAIWWWTNNAKSATIDNGIGEVTNLQDNWKWITPTGVTRDYTITVLGNDGVTVNCKATLTIDSSLKAPECAIGTDPSNIKSGEGTALWWWTSGAKTASINSGIGEVNVPSDWKWVTPTKTTTYTISLVGETGLTSKCSTKVTVENNTPVGKAPVMIVIDDPQYWWLEDLSVEVTELNILKNVDVTLDVIPENMSLSTILGPKLQYWNKNNKSLIQIAQHGYAHTGEEYNMDTISYSKQKAIVNKGLNEFAKLGIVPTSFTPPGGAQNQTTLKVLGELKFKTILDWWSGTTSTDEILTVKQSGVELCNGYDQSGSDCVFKSASTLKKQMNTEIAKSGYTVVVLHIQDFINAAGNRDATKITKYKRILNNLKASENYEFMTVEEYHDKVR